MASNASELIPDFIVSEEMLNAETAQILSMHHNTNVRTFVEGYKELGKPEGWYSFSWETTYTNQDTATLISGLDAVIDVTSINGWELAIGTEDGAESEYQGFDEEEEDDWGFDLSELGSDEANRIRLRIKGYGDLIWKNDMPEVVPAGFAIITGQDIQSDAVQAIVKRTTTDEASQILRQRQDAVADALRNFMQIPFGEPSTELGFTSRD